VGFAATSFPATFLTGVRFATLFRAVFAAGARLALAFAARWAAQRFLVAAAMAALQEHPTQPGGWKWRFGIYSSGAV
jgi:hypothetical protein